MADLRPGVQEAHPDVAAREVAREQALALRIGGATYRAIARAMGISPSTAHDYVTEGLNEVEQRNDEATEEVRRLELQRLDAIFLKLWPKPPQGSSTIPKLDPRTADTLLRVMERRAKLLGLDAPTKWEGSGPGGGPLPLAAAALDLSKLSLPQLRQLESIYREAGLLPATTPDSTASPQPPRSENDNA